MIRTRTAVGLDRWIEQARTSLIAPLARGVSKDVSAVRAAITEPWSNGQTEDQITRLKPMKRQLYGRAKLDLIEARLICRMTPNVSGTASEPEIRHCLTVDGRIGSVHDTSHAVVYRSSSVA